MTGGVQRRGPNTLVVICHPNPASLIRAAATRVIDAVEGGGTPIRVLDLDAMEFDPRLTEAEARHHLGHPDDRPDLATHIEALLWAERLVLIYPTWFSGQPARLKGWFDRVWMHQVAFELPDGANRIQGRLHNIRRIEVVTSMGSTRWVNVVQGNGGRLRVNRTLRILCHRRCRVKWLDIADVDNATDAKRTAWLDSLETYFAGPAR